MIKIKINPTSVFVSSDSETLSVDGSGKFIAAVRELMNVMRLDGDAIRVSDDEYDVINDELFAFAIAVIKSRDC